MKKSKQRTSNYKRADRYVYLFFITFLAFCGCKEKSKEPKSENEPLKKNEINQVLQSNYVTEGYFNRSQGYDWVSAAISRIDPEKIKVRIRSRADRKKPTCTLDLVGYRVSDSLFSSAVDGKEVLISISDKSLAISTRNPQDDGALMFYCSGGATVAGQYQKIEGALDQSQIDQTIFSKTLMLQEIGFQISSQISDNIKKVTIAPFGLEITNRPESFTIDGEVTDAEIEDLNSDGSPEVLVYTTSGENKYGNVSGFSVNNRKSMSQVYFPSIAENEQINDGYMGHDEFRVVETSLVRRFPIFDNKTSNPQRSGKIRQVQYKLRDGEAMRKFVVVNVTEY